MTIKRIINSTRDVIFNSRLGFEIGSSEMRINSAKLSILSTDMITVNNVVWLILIGNFHVKNYRRSKYFNKPLQECLGHNLDPEVEDFKNQARFIEIHIIRFYVNINARKHLNLRILTF
jgi:hypothetical protein